MNRLQCACKKVKIFISAQNSNFMARDICDHIILVVSAVMSDLNLQKEFSGLESAIKAILSDTNDEYQWLGEVSCLRCYTKTELFLPRQHVNFSQEEPIHSI